MLSSKQPLDKSTIFAWSLYDWAQSAFATIVTTFIFATYFTQKIAPNKIIGTRDWGYAAAFAGLVVVLLSPVFGAIADYSGRRKPWIISFTMCSVVGSALFWYAKPSTDYIAITLFAFILGTIGVEMSQVFYNAILTKISPKDYLGRISGWGWGLGYLGGLTSLVIALFVFIEGNHPWLDRQTAAQVRVCGLLVASWIFIFSIPLFLKVHDDRNTGLSIREAIPHGIKTLWHTLKTLPYSNKNVFLFLLARMIYTDGLNTVFAFGGIYAAGTFGMTMSQVILLGIATNISAGLGSMLFAWVDDWLGAKKTILFSLLGLLVFGIWIVLIQKVLLFWILVILLSLFFGPTQAASRSLMAHIVPAGKETEMFGLYAFSGRVTAFIGPWLLGTVTLHYSSQRAGIASVLIFFIIGGLLLLNVKQISKPFYQ